MNIKIESRVLRKSTVDIVSSKSWLHRALICGALSRNNTVLKIRGMGQDIEATLDCLRALGAAINLENKEGYTYIGINNSIRDTGINTRAFLDCRESGTTARFLLPLALALNREITIVGRGRLPLRPMEPLLKALEGGGAVFAGEDRYAFPIMAKGGLRGGEYCLPGNISSQFVSALLMALPILREDSRIVLVSALQSVDYVHMTIDIMRQSGIIIEEFREGYLVRGNQDYHAPALLEAEGDWSAGALWLVMDRLAVPIDVRGLRDDSTQGDRKIKDILDTWGTDTGYVKAMEIDCSSIPDLVPVLAAAALPIRRETVLHHIERLRFKESDRVEAILDMVKALGGVAHVKHISDGESLIVNGIAPSGLDMEEGGIPVVHSRGDHRIAMAAAVASAVLRKALIITDADAVKKSYPEFWDICSSLGMKISEVE